MGARITERDLELLSFIAEHRLVLGAHIQAHLGISAAASYARLRSLQAGGYLRQARIFHHQPGCYQITRAGLAAVGSGYAAPRIDLARYRHDIGVAWLWLAASRGTFGPAHDVISERRMRSADARREPRRERMGIRLGGLGPRGNERLHYPDLLLVLPQGRRVAVELELTAKGRSRREKILGGYAADAKTDVVLYLVESDAIARSITSSARRLGIEQLVHVQRFQWGGARRQRSAPVAAHQAMRAPDATVRARERAL